MIAIIDYGMGNLRSVEKALEYTGYEARISHDKNFIENAEGIVLPGVGAFTDAMENMGKKRLTDVVKKIIAENRPFLGICLGLQLLFDYSEEGGKSVEGLGIFKGVIRHLPLDMGLKVPHIGWNTLDMDKECILFKGLQDNPYVYFVHSFYLDAKDKSMVAATAQYGVRMDAAVNRGNVFATQFHIEKSGDTGLQILRNWAALTEHKMEV